MLNVSITNVSKKAFNNLNTYLSKNVDKTLLKKIKNALLIWYTIHKFKYLKQQGKIKHKANVIKQHIKWSYLLDLLFINSNI